MIYAGKREVFDAYLGTKKVLKMCLGDAAVYAPSLPVSVTIDNVETTSTVGIGGTLSLTLTPATGKQICPWTVVVLMGETDVTSTAYDSSNNTISIASVEDAVTITASAVTMSSSYKPVQYIQNTDASSNGKRFNTSYKPTNLTEVILDVNILEVGTNYGVMGTLTSAAPYLALMSRYSTGSYGRGWWGNKVLESSAFGAYIKVSMRQTITMGKGKLTYYPNGGSAYRTVTFDSTQATPWTSANVLNIGGYMSGSSTFRGNKMRIYGCQIKENDTLVKDYLPCYRVSDSVVGLYDAVNDAFLTQSNGNSDWTIPT